MDFRCELGILMRTDVTLGMEGRHFDLQVPDKTQVQIRLIPASAQRSHAFV